MLIKGILQFPKFLFIDRSRVLEEVRSNERLKDLGVGDEAEVQ